MSHRSNRYLLLPLLALCVSFAAPAPVHAQGTSATLQINFGSQPRWVPIRGTRVREIYAVGRPDYDVYRYGGTYYAFSNDRWYSSRTGRGQFYVIEERYVPREFYRIPRQHWRHYPSRWDREDRGRGNGRGNKHGNGRGHR